MEAKKIKGTRDYFGEEAKKLNFFFDILEEVAELYSYEKIFAPTIEETELFSRSVGNETDVVNKEMYTFEDRKGRSITLKPEGTAQVARMVIENRLIDNNATPNFYYISSMFRYERPQKGRQREFYQFGVENFGKKDIYNDAEIIKFATDILNRLEVTKYELLINNIGNNEDRIKFNDALKQFVLERENDFSKDALEKIKGNNVLRVLDTKNDSDLDILKDAPKINEFISDKSKEDFEKLLKILESMNITYKVDYSLVRGLDYYNDLVFEIVSTDIEKLGAKSTLIGGGRYDSLINKIDSSRDSSAIGFAMGVERMMLAAEEFINKQKITSLSYYIIPAYNEQEMNVIATNIANKLRGLNFSAYVDYEDRKLQKKLDKAEKYEADFAIIIGNEISEGNVTVKDLSSGETKTIKIEEV